MKALLGLLLLSLLLTSGYSLQCDSCVAQSTSCKGTPVRCSAGQDACLSILTEIAVGQTKLNNIMKMCFTKAGCKELKPGGAASFVGAGQLVKSFECSKAPVASGSVFLALSSLLLLKLLW